MTKIAMVFALLLWSGWVTAQDRDWTMNAVLDNAILIDDSSVGAGQGVSRFGDYLYVYGDRYGANPRVGVIKEYDLNLMPTGRMIVLMDRGQVVAHHPTGLTQHPDWGTFFGDTVSGQGIIYQIDWQRALVQGRLDGCVLRRIVDDAAVNGTRPEFVEWQGRAYIASADYGRVTPKLRLYDPAIMINRRQTNPALVAKVSFTPYNQSLFWNQADGTLTTNRNVVAGLGWQIEKFHLATLLEGGRLDTPGARVSKFILPPHDELEGHLEYLGRHLFVTSGRTRNIVSGILRQVPSQTTPAGYRDVSRGPTVRH